MKFKYNTNLGIPLADPLELKPSNDIYRLVGSLTVRGCVGTAIYVRASDIDGYRIRLLNEKKTPVGGLMSITEAVAAVGGQIMYLPGKLSRRYREEEL